MAVSRRLFVYRPNEVQMPDHPLRREREYLANDLHQFGFRNLAGAECVSHNTHRLRDADSVCKLHLATTCKSRRDDILSDISRHIARRAIHLRWVLAGEASAAMASDPAVCIDDNLPSGEAGIGDRAAEHEPSGRIDMIFCILVAHLGRNNRLDNVLLH